MMHLLLDLMHLSFTLPHRLKSKSQYKKEGMTEGGKQTQFKQLELKYNRISNR